MIRSRRLALVAIVFAFGIASCGDPSTTAPLANQPKVIQLAGAQRGAAEMAPAAATAGAADSKMAFMAPTNFVYDGELPTLDGPAASWYFAPGQQPDPDRIAKLAAAFGIQGEVRAMPQDMGGGWAVGPEDYSGPVLTVGSDGMLSWWLSAAPSVISSGCAVAESTEPAIGAGVAGSSGTAVDAVAPAETAPAATPTTELLPVPDCPTPQPPAGVPTKEEALAKAKELFASWGYDVDSYQFDEPYADEWSASVNASLLLDGMKAPIMLSVGFGENGTVTYASGSLATAQRGGDYPTVGAAAGLERLQAQQNQYLGLGDPAIMRATDQGAPQTDIAVAGTAVAAPGVGAVAPDIAPICEAGAATDCGPVNNEPVTVTLNSVKNDLTMVWAADNTIWLLPAYTFGSADGGIYSVIAVPDSFIEQPEEVATTEPVGDPNVTVVLDNPPAPVVSGCLAVPTDRTTPVPADAVKYVADAVIGYCVADAQKLADSLGYQVRVARENGVDLQVTADYSETRINVAVENGAITEVLSIG